MGLSALTQDERLELCFFSRMYLIHWELPSKTLYISDRNFTYDYGSVQHYEDYLFDLSHLPVELARIRPSGNYKITLRFRNERILNKNYLIELNDTYRFCFSTLKIYELRLVQSGETFASDVKQLIFRGVCGQPYSITRKEVFIDVHNVLLAKRDRLPLQVVDTDTFPNADPDDIGKIRNTVYGTVEHVPCRAVVAGALDTLKADIDADDTTIYLSGVTKASFPTSNFTIQIDEEQIRISSRSGNTLTVDSGGRAYNETTANNHDKGAAVAEVLTEYIYEAARYPVKAIDNVYAMASDGRMVLVDTGDYTAYTGQSGDQKSGYGATAVIVFTVLAIIKKQVALDVSEGLHGHAPVGGTTDQRYPTGTGGGSGTNHTNMDDSDENTYARMTGGGAEYNTCYVTFSNSGSGTVTERKCRFMYSSTSPQGNDKVKIGSAAYQAVPATGGVDNKSTIERSFAGDEWDLTVTFYHEGDYGEFRVHEVYWCEVTYGTGVESGAATGVALSGNSSADTVIGRMVTADIRGIQDDASGTITGTPNALIERPDHVLEHVLTELLGESASDIGSSFATSGTSYGSTYKLDFILHEIAKLADELLQKLAFQCRSKFLEWHGKFELIYLGSAPSATRTFTEDDLLEEPRFDYTPEIDIRNRIYAHYRRDYRKGGGLDSYDAVETDSDSTSITKNGERIDRIELSACRTQAMAANWVAWYLAQKKDELKTVELALPWLGKLIGAADAFSLTWDFWSGEDWDPESIEIDPDTERIRIEAQEWPA